MPNPFEKYLRPEDRFHRACIQYLNSAHSKLRYYHSPSEGKRSKFEQYLLSTLGGRYRAGFPDIIILNPSNKYSGFVAELKVKAYPTKEQKEWIEFFATIGYHSVIIRNADIGKGLDQFMDEVNKYLEGD